MVAYRHWCNKLWNAIKFAMINLGDSFQAPTDVLTAQQLPFGCQWILSRLAAAIDTTTKALHAYDFSTATQVIRAQLFVCILYMHLLPLPRSATPEVPKA